MASRPLGDVWLRPSSLARIHQMCTARKRTTPLSWSTQRCISSSSPNHAAQPQLKEAVEEEQQYPTQDAQPLSQQALQHKAMDTVSSLFHCAPGSNTSQAESTSSEELRNARLSRPYGSRFSQPGRSPFQRSGLPAEELDLPAFYMNPNRGNKPSEATTLKKKQEETFANFPRLNPSYGRTVELYQTRGRDLVRSIGMLNSLVARNKLKGDFYKQRFHERPGLKRKRLKSERWRARFKIGFDEVTKRVTELTKKGW